MRPVMKRLRRLAVGLGLILGLLTSSVMSAADAGDLPWAVFSPFTPFLRSPGLPPVGPGMRPRTGPIGVIRDLGVRSVVSAVMDRPMLGRINAIRARVGAPAVGSAWPARPVSAIYTGSGKRSGGAGRFYCYGC